MLDSTDVNLWYKIGSVALRLMRLPLARHAFEEGLICNPDHWPCLDNLITILYTLSDYTSKLCPFMCCFVNDNVIIAVNLKSLLITSLKLDMP